MKNGNNRRRIIILAVFGVIGAGSLIHSFALNNTVAFEAEGGQTSGNAIVANDLSASNGKHIRFGAVRRFFSPDASWNKTVDQMGGKDEFLSNSVNPSDSIKNYAKRLWDYGGGYERQPVSPPGNFNLNFKNYSVPIYDMTTKTTDSAKVFQLGWAIGQQVISHTGLNIGSTIPWNPSWKPGTGNDKILHIVNYSTGKAYELWVVEENKSGCALILGNVIAGFDINNPNHICLAAIETYDNLFTAKDGDGSTMSGRGMGINNLALVVRADEVKTGNIGHALPITVSNAMFGPDMVSPATDPTQSGAGVSKGFYLPPATRLEHINPVTLTRGSSPLSDFSDTARSKTIPSGMRFALHISDAEITSWLDNKGYTGVLRDTARTFAKAWRDYGAIVAETGGYGIGIETDGLIGPAKNTWAELGIVDDGSTQPFGNLLDGLITEQRLYVVKPPVY